MKALIIVDMQNDFIEGGALAVSGGLALIPKVSKVLKEESYDLIVSTQDWHIKPGAHFSNTPDFIDTWPVHCVAGSFGGEIVSPLKHQLKRLGATSIFKGQFAAAYSGFEGTDAKGRSLQKILEDSAITEVDIIGLAEDYCVFETAKGAAEAGFKTRVLTSLTRGINMKKVKETRKILESLEVENV